MRVFITGGSGFIGSRLVSTLIERGHAVVCMSRSGKSSAHLHDLGAQIVSADITDAGAVRSALREARPERVAHLAAEIATQRDERRIEAVNVKGTQIVVDACRDLDLDRFLFLSTVVRGMANGETFTESDEIPATTAYGRSKARGDELVLGAHRDWGLPAVVLRPSHVYGPGGWLADLLSDRMFRIPGKGENLWDVVHVDDVVHACTTLLDRGEAGEVYHVVDDEPVTMNQFFGWVAAALGRKPFKHAPVWLAKLLRGAGPITAAVRSARSTNDKLKGLGWQPAHPRSEDAVPAVVRALVDRSSDEPEPRPQASGMDTQHAGETNEAT